ALTFPPLRWPRNGGLCSSAGLYGGSGMRSGQPAAFSLEDGDHGFQAFLRGIVKRCFGLALGGFSIFAVASLGTWNVGDPSFSHATANPVTNAMGYAGAVFSDLTMQFFGLSAVAALLPIVFWAVCMMTGRNIDRIGKRSLAWLGAALLLAGIAGCIAAPATWPLPTGLGGVFGDL